MRSYLGLITLIFAVVACENGECPFQKMRYMVNNASNSEEIATITAQGCSTDQADIAISPEYVGRIYFAESVNNLGEETYHAFEKGYENTRNVEIVEQSTNHIIEIIEKNTFINNLNNPYPIEVDDFKLSGEEGNIIKTGKADVELKGHPLQLILALQDVDDEGGAKTWKFHSAKDAETNVAIPLNDVDWECFFDNSYTYMKGKRFKYDPNGTLCNNEKDYFPKEDPFNVYGKYSINSSGKNPIVVLEIVDSGNSTRSENIEITEWSIDDWNTLTVKVKNPKNDKEAVALMKVSQTVEWSEF